MTHFRWRPQDSLCARLPFFNYIGICLHISVYILSRWRKPLSSMNSFVSVWALWWLVPRAQAKAPSGSCYDWPLVKWARRWNTTQWTQRLCHELRLVFLHVDSFLSNDASLQVPKARLQQFVHWTKLHHVSTSEMVVHDFAEVASLSTSATLHTNSYVNPVSATVRNGVIQL